MSKKQGPLYGLTKEQISQKLAEDTKGARHVILSPEPNPRSRTGVDESGGYKTQTELYGNSHGGLQVHSVNLHNS